MKNLPFVLALWAMLPVQALSQAPTLPDAGSLSAAQLDSMVSMLFQEGRYQESLVYALQNMELLNRQPDALLRVKGMVDVALLYFSLGEYGKSERLYLQTIQVVKDTLGETHLKYAELINDLGVLYMTWGKEAAAEKLFWQASDINKKQGEPALSYYASNLSNLATLYRQLGNLKKAEPLYLEALEIDRKVLDEQSMDYASSLNGLAVLYQNDGRYAEAERLFVQVGGIIKKNAGEQHPHYASALNNLAACYTATRRYEQAEALYRQTLARQEGVLPAQHPNYLQSLNNMANLYAYKNQPEQAYPYLYRSFRYNGKDSLALDLTDPASITGLVGQEFYSGNQALTGLEALHRLHRGIYETKGELAALQCAHAALSAALAISDRLRGELGDDDDKLRLLRQASKSIGKALHSGLQLWEQKRDSAYLYQAFGYAEQNKSVLLLDALKGQQARRMGNLPDSLAEREKQLQNDKKRLERAAATAKTEAEKAEVRSQQSELQVEISRFVQNTQTAYPEYYNLKYQPNHADAKQLQAALPDDALFLEYCLADEAVYVFALTRSDLRLIPIDIKSQDLARRIALLRSALTDYEQIVSRSDENFKIYTEQASWFYEHWLRPALPPEGKPIRKLLIVADGELGHLPFEVFLVEPPAPTATSYAGLHYLIKDYDISYHYSAMLWTESRKSANRSRSQNGGLLAMAARYSGAPDPLRPSLPALNNLPAARSELQALETKFDGMFCYDERANETLFKQNAQNYSVIHLAMHGLLNKRAPILSCLAFTSVPDSVEDNLLEAWEISKMQIGADLVVLSACETGYGTFSQGEGVLSLARSFLYAGVPAMLVSLWEVNDMATSRLMLSFYEQLAAGKAKDAALRQAKLDYLTQAKGINAHPAYWSPFILVGNDQPISLQSKGGNKAWLLWLAAGGAAVLLLGLWVRRKRAEL